MKRFYIAFISFSSPTDYSGSSRYAHELSTALAKLGNNVTVFTVKGDNVPTVYPYKVKRLSFADLPHLRFPSFALAVSKEISKDHFDIVHSHAGSGFFLPILHVETHHHTPIAFNALPHYLPAFTCVIRAKKIIAVSEVSKQDLVHYGITEHKIVVIYNGVDFNRFNSSVDGKGFRNALGINDAKLLLYVGGFNRNKNLILLLKVMKRLKKMGRKVFFLMVGKQDKEEKRIMDLAKVLNVSDVVRTIWLPDRILPQAYAACDLYVCSSKKEGFGLPILEAVACGKRFVSTPVGIAPKLEKMGFGRTVSYSTDVFLRKVIEEFDGQPYSPSSEILEKEFDWMVTARKTVQVYETVMKDCC